MTGAPPTAGAGCGAGATVSGSDGAGRITLGAAPAASCTLTFSSPWNPSPPVCCFNNDSRVQFLALSAGAVGSVTFTSSGPVLTGGDNVSYLCLGKVTDVCVAVPAQTDPINDCDLLSCRTGNCDGAAACKFVAAQTDPNNNCASLCQVCGGSSACVNTTVGTDPMADCPLGTCRTGNCDGLGSCQFPADDAACGVCAVCGSLATCAMQTTSEDLKGECAPLACTNTGNCNGAGACEVVPNGLDPNAVCTDCNVLGGCSFVPSLTQDIGCNASPCNECDGVGGCVLFTCNNHAFCNGANHCDVGGVCVVDTGGLAIRPIPKSRTAPMDRKAPPLGKHAQDREEPRKTLDLIEHDQTLKSPQGKHRIRQTRQMGRVLQIVPEYY